MKKVLKWVAIIVLVPIVLFLLLFVLLYLPPVQNWAVKKAAAYASEQTGMDISVGHVALRFPLNLTLEEVKAIKDNDSIPGLRDTIADVGRVHVDVQWKPLLKKNVEIDALSLEKVKLNTNGFIPDVRVKGNVESLDLECHGVDLKNSLANIDKARLDSARLEICLSDTVPPDTTETENDWRIRLQQLQLSRADVSVRMPGDTLQVQAYIGDAEIKGGDFNLADGAYRVASFDWNSGRLRYDDRFAPHVSGLDTSHIDLNDIHLSVDSLSYVDSKLNLAVRSCSLKEKSGIQIDHLSGKVALDSTSVNLPDLRFETPDSKLTASLDMDLSTFDAKNPGQLAADVDGYFGKQDLMRFMGNMPSDFVRKWPNRQEGPRET